MSDPAIGIPVFVYAMFAVWLCAVWTYDHRLKPPRWLRGRRNWAILATGVGVGCLWPVWFLLLVADCAWWVVTRGSVWLVTKEEHAHR